MSEQNPISKKQIIDYIKNDNEVYVETDEGYDITKEFLIKTAFGSKLNKPIGTEWHLMDYLIYAMSIDEIYDIIRAGGIENYLRRKRVC